MVNGVGRSPVSTVHPRPFASGAHLPEALAVRHPARVDLSPCHPVADGDPDPHNHPFSRSVNLILKGGYTERRGIHGESTREHGPGRLNRIAGDDVHRIDALRDGRPVWTLFWAGKPHGRGWGFYVDGTFVDHKIYLADKTKDLAA